MTIWYDVSDVMGWQLPHLTGIQRTTVGILNGLVALGIRVRLANFDKARGDFVAVEVTEMPEAIRKHFPWATGKALHPTVPDEERCERPCPSPPMKRRVRDRLLGQSTAAQELRAAFREFKAATKKLRKKASQWTWIRYRETMKWVAKDQPAVIERTIAPLWKSATHPCEPPAFMPVGPIAAGDVLLSLGASWVLPRHDLAVAALRSRGVRVVRMIYDLIPTLKPQWVDDPTASVNISGPITQWARNVISDSDRVLTISEFSRQEIDRFCAESRIPSAPLSVIRLGDVLEPGACGEPPLPRVVPSRPFFLCVSTLDVRKNHRLLYDAWSVLAGRDRETCPDLVCIGTPHLYVRDLVREIQSDREVNQRIHVLRDVADEELAWYYRNCAATIYPSRYEGWGLPVAESLCHGRLCLASNATSIPEISADLPEFFDPLDVYGLVALVRRTLDDPAWVKEREAEIRQRFVATLWTDTAAQVMAAVEAVTLTRGVHAA